MLERIHGRGFKFRKGDGRKVAEVMEGEISCPFCKAKLSGRSSFLDHVHHAHKKEIGAELEVEEMSDFDALRIIVAALDSEEMAEESFLRELHRIDEPGRTRRETAEAMGMEAEDVDQEDIDRALKPTSLADVTQIREKLIQLIAKKPLLFLFRISERIVDRNNIFKLLSKEYQLRLNRLGKAACLLGCGVGLMEAFLLAICEGIKSYAEDEGKEGERGLYVAFSVTNSDSINTPLTSPYLIPSQESVHAFMSSFSMLATSKPSLFLDQDFKLTVTCLGVDASDTAILTFGGGVRHASQHATEVECVLRKQAFLISVPRGLVFLHDCLLTATVIGILFRRCGGKIGKRNVFRNPMGASELPGLVRAFAQMVKEVDWSVPQGLEACKIIQSVLNRPNYGYQLVIFKGLDYKDRYFTGYPKRGESKQILLILFSHHLGLIKSARSFYSLKRCEQCQSDVRRRGSHFCRPPGKSCRKCGSVRCLMETAMGVNSEKAFDICPECNGVFGGLCIDYHKTEDAGGGAVGSMCSRFVYCDRCAKRLPRKEEGGLPAHVCLERQCFGCNETYTLLGGTKHLCVVQRPTLAQLGILGSFAIQHGIQTFPQKELNPNPTPPPESLQPEKYSTIVGDYALVFFDIGIPRLF